MSEEFLDGVIAEIEVLVEKISDGEVFLKVEDHGYILGEGEVLSCHITRRKMREWMLNIIRDEIGEDQLRVFEDIVRQAQGGGHGRH